MIRSGEREDAFTEFAAAASDSLLRAAFVLVCRYLLDATVAETAVALGIAEGTVKSATSRGWSSCGT